MRAILWMDAVLVAAVALAVVGMPPVVGHAPTTWTWIVLAGSTLTAMLAALSAFELCVPGRSQAWLWLPAPAFVLWIAATGLGCFALPVGADAWGDTLAEAAECLGFLLKTSLPLFALIVFMLWRAARSMPGRVLAMGAIASAGAAASLLALVHPHDASFLDLGAHAIALAIALAISAVVARVRAERDPTTT